MRSTLLGAVLALATAMPAAADDRITTGLDLMRVRTSADISDRIVCHAHVGKAVQSLGFPEVGFGLVLNGKVNWETCPHNDPRQPDFAHWVRYLPRFVVQYWRERAPQPGRLATLPWHDAATEALIGMFPRCAGVGSS
jgi:hypothetical protein